MKHNGKWDFAGHALPGKLLTYLHYAGLDQKKVLIEQAKKRGAQIIGRLTGYELLRDESGSIIGAIAVHNKEPRAVVFAAPTVVLGTGAACVMECPVPGAIHLRIPLPQMILYK